MILIRESSTEPEPKPKPKLVRYANGFKILVSREPEPNPTRTKIFRVSEYIGIRFMYLNILAILYLISKKISKMYRIF